MVVAVRVVRDAPSKLRQHLAKLLGGGGDDGDEIGEVNGYPIKHRVAFDIVEDEIVTYTKAAKSKARYAAGYFAIEFEHGWTPSYCPRIQTVLNNTYIGPFRSKLEMQNAMSQKKRVSKL